MTPEMNAYIKEQLSEVYDEQTNNCCHFAAGYYGLRHKVPDNPGGDFTDILFKALADEAFVSTSELVTGNICLCTVRGKAVVGLRFSPILIVFRAERGITHMRITPHKEWRKD